MADPSEGVIRIQYRQLVLKDDKLKLIRSVQPTDATGHAAITPSVGDGRGNDRQRGVYDDALPSLAKTLVASCGSAVGVLEKFYNDFGGREAELSDALLHAFPKGPRKGVCYANFGRPPQSNKASGNLHPNMLAHNRCAYDLYRNMYEKDSFRNVAEISTSGYSGVLKVRPLGGHAVADER